MQLPIVMTAFGTTSTANATYAGLNNALQGHFPEAEIIWSYSSKKISRKLYHRQTSVVLHPEAVLQNLAARGTTRAILQSLHLFPGSEFHALVQLRKKARLDCALGMPLLTSAQDYHGIGEILRPLITARPDTAMVVLGHGTNHPSWTAYYSLEKILRLKFGARIFVGVVEKYPDSSHLVDEITRNGYEKVCIIPFFLVAGMHYQRDIVGDGPASWQSRFHLKGIEVETIDHGLGMYPGLDKIVIRHIIEAAQTLGIS